jgi:hypothetical protein
MICQPVSPSTTSTNLDSYSHSVATQSNVSEKNKVQMPSSSFMRGVNVSTQPAAVDISFIQVDVSSTSFHSMFYGVSHSIFACTS